MKFLCDVHIAYKVFKYLKTINPASLHINEILNKWHTSDNDISNYADENDFVVVSKDADFVNSYFIKQSPKKLIKVSLGNISNAHFIEIFKTYTPTILNLESYAHFFVEIGVEGISTIVDE